MSGNTFVAHTVEYEPVADVMEVLMKHHGKEMSEVGGARSIDSGSAAATVAIVLMNMLIQSPKAERDNVLKMIGKRCDERERELAQQKRNAGHS